MSGKPYPEGVTKAVDLMDECAALNDEIQELHPKVQRMREAEVRYGQAYVELQKLLREMDLESQGHFGYENRLAWFLMEMRHRLEARKNDLQDNAGAK